MVSVLALYSNNLSSIRAEVYNFSVQIVVVEKNKINKKGRGGPIKKTKQMPKIENALQQTFF